MHSETKVQSEKTKTGMTFRIPRRAKTRMLRALLDLSELSGTRRTIQDVMEPKFLEALTEVEEELLALQEKAPEHVQSTE
jgi:hypothetical protein